MKFVKFVFVCFKVGFGMFSISYLNVSGRFFLWEIDGLGILENLRKVYL